jgi:hypothetical protein
MGSCNCSPIQQKIGRGLGWEGLDKAEKGGGCGLLICAQVKVRKWLGQLKKKRFFFENPQTEVIVLQRDQ